MEQSLAEIVDRASEVYVLPEIHSRLSLKLDDPYASNHEIADLIMLDAGLSFRLLRIANSAFYGLPAEVANLAQAISVVGRAAVAKLVLGVAVIGAFEALPVSRSELRAHWRHSILCGLLARSLAARVRPAVDTESLFIAGLLHDIGRLIVRHAAPADALAAWREISSGTVAPSESHAAEDAHFGCEHALVGAMLLRKWRLPELFAAAARWHHQPAAAETHAREVALVAIADALSHCPVDATATIVDDDASFGQFGFAAAELAEVRRRGEEQLDAALNCFL